MLFEKQSGVPAGPHPATVASVPPPHSSNDDFEMVMSLFFAHLENINNVVSTMAHSLLSSATTATFIPFPCQFVKLLLPSFVTDSVTTLRHHKKSNIL